MSGADTTDAPPRRYVIHLIVTSADLASARLLARNLTRWLEVVPELSGGETTISEENDQLVQREVFCDRLLDAGRRCPQEADHLAACLPEPRRAI